MPLQLDACLPPVSPQEGNRPLWLLGALLHLQGQLRAGGVASRTRPQPRPLYPLPPWDPSTTQQRARPRREIRTGLVIEPM